MAKKKIDVIQCDQAIYRAPQWLKKKSGVDGTTISRGKAFRSKIRSEDNQQHDIELKMKIAEVYDSEAIDQFNYDNNERLNRIERLVGKNTKAINAVKETAGQGISSVEDVLTQLPEKMVSMVLSSESAMDKITDATRNLVKQLIIPLKKNSQLQADQIGVLTQQNKELQSKIERMEKERKKQDEELASIKKVLQKLLKKS